VENYLRCHYSLETLWLDDCRLPVENLRPVPQEIFLKGSTSILAYFLTLFQSPESEPIYRAKVVALGGERVGKTTLLDNLFPLTGWLQSQGVFKKTSYWFKLQGKYLAKFDNPDDLHPHKDRITIIDGDQWEVSSLLPKAMGFKLGSKNPSVRDIELICQDKDTHDLWLLHLKKACQQRVDTHGISVKTMEMKNEVVKTILRGHAHLGAKQPSTLHLSIWDFGGHQDYYHAQHYFLTPRSVFVVVWDLSLGDEGLKGLQFWLRALATHVAPPAEVAAAALTASLVTSTTVLPKPQLLYSIIVVGTHLDDKSVRAEQRGERATKIDQLARACGHFEPVQYFEVSSSSTLENVDAFQDAVISTALSHSYMGERQPREYLSITSYVAQAREDRSSIPVMETPVLFKHFRDEALVRKALAVSTLWGDIFFAAMPPELSSLVVLDPRFLFMGIISDLFRPNTIITTQLRREGILQHADLLVIWNRLLRHQGLAKDEETDFCLTSISVLNQLGICFVLPEDRRSSKPFMEQRSVVTALLPEKPADPLPRTEGYPSRFQTLWPSEPPASQPVQLEKLLRLNTMPAELVSRFWCHINHTIVDGLLWRNDGVVAAKEVADCLAWVRFETARERLVIQLRGRETKDCLRLYECLLGQFKELLAGGFPGIQWEERLRSPYFVSADVSVQEAEWDAHQEEQDRKLVCPETGFPIHAEILLERAGLFTSSVSRGLQTWWPPRGGSGQPPLSSTLAPPSLSVGGGGDNRRGDLLTQVSEGKEVLQPELFGMFKTLLDGMNGRLEGVERVFAVENSKLAASFDTKRLDITRRHLNHDLYKNDDWRQTKRPMSPESGQDVDAEIATRKDYLRTLAAHVNRFRPQFNDGTQSPVLPAVLVGASESYALQMADQGLSSRRVSTIGTEGGASISFSGNLDYAVRDARETAQGSGLKVACLSLVIAGDTYPATEGHSTLVSQKFGYHSHYRVLDSSAGVDELTIFDGAQALPVFLVYFRPQPSPIPKSSALSKIQSLDLSGVEEASYTLEKLLSMSREDPKAEGGSNTGATTPTITVVTATGDSRRASLDDADTAVRALREENAKLKERVTSLEQETRRLEKATAAKDVEIATLKESLQAALNGRSETQ